MKLFFGRFGLTDLVRQASFPLQTSRIGTTHPARQLKNRPKPARGSGRFHQPSEWKQVVFFNRVDLYHKSPDSGERQYKSRTCETQIRALLLESAGYRTAVFEFVGGEHTAKNVMITAVKVWTGLVGLLKPGMTLEWSLSCCACFLSCAYLRTTHNLKVLRGLIT